MRTIRGTYEIRKIVKREKKKKNVYSNPSAASKNIWREVRDMSKQLAV